MCGLAGIYAPGELDRDAGDHLWRMTDALRQRGPDDVDTSSLWSRSGILHVTPWLVRTSGSVLVQGA